MSSADRECHKFNRHEGVCLKWCLRAVMMGNVQPKQDKPEGMTSKLGGVEGNL